MKETERGKERGSKSGSSKWRNLEVGRRWLRLASAHKSWLVDKFSRLEAHLFINVVITRTILFCPVLHFSTLYRGMRPVSSRFLQLASSRSSTLLHSIIDSLLSLFLSFFFFCLSRALLLSPHYLSSFHSPSYIIAPSKITNSVGVGRTLFFLALVPPGFFSLLIFSPLERFADRIWINRSGQVFDPD